MPTLKDNESYTCWMQGRQASRTLFQYLEYKSSDSFVRETFAGSYDFAMKALSHGQECSMRHSAVELNRRWDAGLTRKQGGMDTCMFAADRDWVSHYERARAHCGTDVLKACKRSMISAKCFRSTTRRRDTVRRFYPSSRSSMLQRVNSVSDAQTRTH